MNKWNVVCVVNGQVFRVRHISDCASQRVEYRRVVRKKVRAERRVVVQQGCGCSYGGGQDVIVGGFIGSRAAVQQARRRANAYGGGYVTGGGYVDDGGYGEGQVVIRRKHMKRKRKVVYYDPGYGYNPGVIYHTGPIITKSGGY